MSRSTLKDKTVDKRIPLKRNTKITLCIDASLNKTYVIDKYMGCGGFALTYVAHEKGNYPIEYVVLKEFYPCWEDMGRNENNGIIFSDKENPHSLCHSFFDHETEMTELASKIYDKAGTETMQNNPEVFSFKGPYISDNGNFYCIINTVAGEPFENFVDECRGENEKNYRLEKIFDIFIKVAKQLSSLHGDKKMYHLDLSFSNIYLVKMQGGTEIHPFIIDYGSAYVKGYYEREKRKITHNVFSSPEIKMVSRFGLFNIEEYVDESADIYSLCSMLYYAITGFIYPEIVKAAKLREIRKKFFMTYPEEIYDEFAEVLFEFFQKGLSEKKESRFQSATEFIRELMNLRGIFSTKGILSNVSDDDLMSYYLLHKYPMYKPFGGNEDIEVLCLGSGRFIERIVLAMLSTGQMLNRKLKISVVSKDAEEFRSRLLRLAPELEKYSDICGPLHTANDYISFSFENVKNLVSSRGYTYVAKKYSQCKYTVISLGKNELNYQLSSKYASCFDCDDSLPKKNNERYVLYYTGEDMDLNNSSDIKKNNIPSFVHVMPFSSEEMAFEMNEIGHFAFRLDYYYKKLNDPHVSAEEELHNFSHDKDGYSQKSSLASALHVKYKLASLRIFSEDNYLINTLSSVKKTDVRLYRQKLAEMYSKKMKKQKNELIELEQRRWLMFTVACGYRLPTMDEMDKYAFEYLENGTFNKGFKCKTSPRFYHHCLVPCGKTGVVLTKKEKEFWDSFATYDEIDKCTLDELDKMSLKVHLLASKKMKNSSVRNNIKWHFERLEKFIPRENKVLHELFDDVYSLSERVAENPDMLDYFVLQLKKLKGDFEKNNINAEYWFFRLNEVFSVFKEFNSYVDYKAYNETIVENLMRCYLE